MDDSTEVRLENLERQLAETKAELCRVRRRTLWLLRGGLLLIGILALAWIFKSTVHPVLAQGEATVHKEIQAKKFLLVDAGGQKRAMLSVHEDDLALTIFSPI